MRGSTEKRTRGRGDRLTVVILVGIAAGLLLVVGGGAILYRRGVQAGRAEAISASREAVEEIAKTVEMKEALTEKLKELEGITDVQAYRERLEKISTETEDETLKNMLSTLAEEVRAYGEVEATGDQVASEYELAQLKGKVETTEQAIQGWSKARLESAVAKLD
ncbi:hypothetical protein IJI72_01835 [Candidatus Saccharibacteria bacterium]|nr:hypothetical protein [Candidatus Saccharibacteria bacterium]